MPRSLRSDAQPRPRRAEAPEQRARAPVPGRGERRVERAAARGLRVLRPEQRGEGAAGGGGREQEPKKGLTNI